MSVEPLNVGLVGMGTVGTGVVRLLYEEQERMSQRAGRPVHLKKVLVRDLNKPREFEIPAHLMTDAPERLLDDPEIDVVAEVIGGIHPAKEYIEQALRAGKHVVTANKALLCEHAAELFVLAREQNSCIGFEAAVGGGIPIIKAMVESLAVNDIQSVEAILNGTCNFILSQMTSEGWTYEEALTEAQRLGFAEADPTLDVNGTDTAQKLVLLTQLAFGVNVGLSDFPCSGIDSLDSVDLQLADELHYVIKLLAVAKRDFNGQLEMHVQPTLIHESRPLAKVDGPYNMVSLVGDAVGPTWFSGLGAGQMATASAVVSDILDLAIGRAQQTFPGWPLFSSPSDTPSSSGETRLDGIQKCRYYLRFHVEDRPHVIADIAHILGEENISISSVIQHEVPEVIALTDSSCQLVPLVIMTHTTTSQQLQAAHEKLSQLACLHGAYTRIPVAD